MGTAETLASQLAHVDVLFHFDKSAESFLDGMLMNFERLLDDDTALHLPFDQIYFCIGTALERLPFVEALRSPVVESMQSAGRLSRRKRQPVV